jgi:hypothetical protein
MEGGIALLLLVIIAVVGGGIALAMYVTGGALWFSNAGEKGKGDEPRPEHKEVTAPHLEHTNFGRTEDD